MHFRKCALIHGVGKKREGFPAALANLWLDMPVRSPPFSFTVRAHVR